MPSFVIKQLIKRRFVGLVGWAATRPRDFVAATTRDLRPGLTVHRRVRGWNGGWDNRFFRQPTTGRTPSPQAACKILKTQGRQKKIPAKY